MYEHNIKFIIMGLFLYRMEFPLRYNLDVDAIVDSNNEVIAELSAGCRADMEYLVLAANEKYARDNNSREIPILKTSKNGEWK